MEEVMSKTPTRSMTAHHEAGHAVAVVVQGLMVESVTIKPGGESLGSCVHPGILMYEGMETRQAQRRAARQCIIVSYAGLQAEQLFHPDAPEECSRGDEENAWNLSKQFEVFPRKCTMIGDEAHCSYMERLRGEARRIVRTHRSAIAAVAEGLQEHETLSGQEVKEIVAGV